MGETPHGCKNIAGPLLPYPSTAGGWKQKEYRSAIH